MSTEIDELEKRVAVVEKSLAGWIATELARNPLNAMCSAEPAPVSDAKHPPLGYRLVEMGGKVDKASVCWKHGIGPWVPNTAWTPGYAVGPANSPVANPIPANEGDSQKAESTQDLSTEVRRLTAENAELRATVAGHKAEIARLAANLAAEDSAWRKIAGEHFQNLIFANQKNARLRDQLTKMLEEMQ